MELLDDAGFQVTVPNVDLCCGRPLYDYGMLERAKRWLEKILGVLQQDIEAGTPMVVLEPSCATVFRHELTELFPQNQNARRLSKQTFTLAELFEERAKDYQLPRLNRRVLLHGHCHHKAVLNFESEKKLLGKMELKIDLPDSGCCGMAGAFGFEKDHYDVSIACGERVLLPAVRQASRETLIIADGFSCREQIRQGTERIAFHTAQVLKMAIEQSSV